MPWKSEIKAALAVCAAVAGVGLASGREVAHLFSGGAGSWLALLAFCAAVGALTYVLVRLSERSNFPGFPAPGASCHEAAWMLHGLFCLLSASALLTAAARLGALTFSCGHAGWLGLFLTRIAVAAAVEIGETAPSATGAALLIGMLVFYAPFAMGEGESVASSTYSSGQGLLAPVPIALLYACFHVAQAAGAICHIAQSHPSAGKTGWLTGIFMLLATACIRLALLQSGDGLPNAPFPIVVLSSRWGVSGYYIGIALMWLALFGTLCALCLSLRNRLTSAGLSSRAALAVGLGAPALLCALRINRLISIAYPLLAWICVFMLLLLLLFLPCNDW